MSQQQQQQLEARINQHLLEARRNAHNALRVGDSTISELQQQSETLQRTETLLDEQEQLVQQSLRVLRGMTWSGSLYNVYSDISSVFSGAEREKEIETDSREKERDRDRDSEGEKRKGELNRSELKELPIAMYRSNVLPPPPPPTSCSARANEEDAVLDELSSAIETLKSMGVVMGEQLQQQNTQIDRIDANSDRVHDKTLAASIKASKLNKSAQRDEGSYIGTFQFLATSNLFMLATNQDNALILTTSADLNTLFKCFIRQNTVIGLQSEVTGKFVGCTMWGNIAVSGDYFGSHEECYIDLEGNDSGLMFPARNWGGGGWLKLNEPIPSEVQPTGDHQIIITATTSSMIDRDNMITFRAIKCK